MCDKAHYEELKEELEGLREQIIHLEDTAGKSIQHFLDDMKELKTMIKEHKDSNAELNEAWRNASGFAKVVKWAAGFILACGVIWAFVHQVLTYKIGG